MSASASKRFISMSASASKRFISMSANDNIKSL
jgi:hypothetical protein